MKISDYIATLTIKQTSFFQIYIIISFKNKTYGTYLEYLHTSKGQDIYEYASKVETWMWTGNVYSDDIEKEDRLSKIHIVRDLYEN